MEAASMLILRFAAPPVKNRRDRYFSGIIRRLTAGTLLPRAGTVGL
jgi:hypothetical protein